jgi:hypothetical protein
MAPGSTGRLQIPDARGGGASLRISWHAAQRKVVFSHWRDGVCVATTPVDLAEVPGLINVLVAALGQAATGATRATAPSRRRDLFAAFRQWLQPKLAHIAEFAPIHAGPVHPGRNDPHHRRAG